MKFSDWAKMRAQWVKARDGAKVKSGAVKGASMGEALDAVAKASTHRKLVTATTALLKTGAAYRAGAVRQPGSSGLLKPADDVAQGAITMFDELGQTLKRVVA